MKQPNDTPENPRMPLTRRNYILLAAGFGEPAERQRKVTVCARVQESLGLNVSALVPEVIPFSTAQRTAS